jgi:hypothetical protein
VSAFRDKVIKVTPLFSGTQDEILENEHSHKWKIVRLSKRFNEVEDPSLIVAECSTCSVISTHPAAQYKCGDAPRRISLKQWQKENPALKY